MFYKTTHSGGRGGGGGEMAREISPGPTEKIIWGVHGGGGWVEVSQTAEDRMVNYKRGVVLFSKSLCSTHLLAARSNVHKRGT